jgi:hypothetical protein
MTRLDSNAIVNSVVDIDKIHPHPRNYTIHPESQLAGLEKSHAEFGQYRSVVLWSQPDGEYTQVAGHGYVEAARRRKETRIRADILPADTPPGVVESIMIADNMHPRRSGENLDILSQLMKDQQKSGVNLLALGSSDKEVDELMRRMVNSHATDFLQPIIQQSAPPEISFEDEDEEDEQPVSAVSRQSPSEEQQWFPMTFTFGFSQRETVLSAIHLAKERWHIETSADAIVQICATFVGG